MPVAELRIETPQGSVLGELLTPDKPKLAALLIGGSGPHDRDGVHGEFDAGYRAWAETWAAQGIATLRTDKPGSGASPLPRQRPARYAHDLIRNEAALTTLRQALPTLPTALIGHSLGALTALELPQEGLSAIAHIAGMGRTIDRLIANQVLDALETAEAPQDKINQHLAERLDLMETFKQGGVVKNLPPWAGEDPEPWIHLGDIARRDPVTLIASCPTPLILIQGTADDRVFDIDWKFARAAAPKAPALLVEDTDHCLRTPAGTPHTKALEWIGQQLLNQI